MIKEYSTLDAEKDFSLDYNFQQVFHHEFARSSNVVEYYIIREYQAPQYKDERQAGLVILNFMRYFGFATRAQLAQMLEQKGVSTDNLDTILDHYVNRNIMNFFIAAAMPIDIPEDALRVYCLDSGAIFILNHFSGSDCVTWMTSDSKKSIRLVVKYLTPVRFYLSMTETKRNELHYFRPLADFNTGARQTRFSADFQIKSGFTERNFILEVIRKEDFPIDWLKKVDTQIEPFISLKRWEYYYGPEPVFIVLAENKDVALEASDIFYRRLRSDQFRVTTDEEIAKGMAKAKFFKYVPATEEEHQKLVPVKAGIFLPSKK